MSSSDTSESENAWPTEYFSLWGKTCRQRPMASETENKWTMRITNSKPRRLAEVLLSAPPKPMNMKNVPHIVSQADNK